MGKEDFLVTKAQICCGCSGYLSFSGIVFFLSWAWSISFRCSGFLTPYILHADEDVHRKGDLLTESVDSLVHNVKA